MDLKHYFRRLRETEEALSEEYPLVTSLETGDGGKAGRVTEVTRIQAAQLIVEGRALLATAGEKAQYLADQKAAKDAAEKAELAKRLQVAFVTESDLHNASNRKK